MPQEFEKLPQDKIFDGIDKASKLIEVGLNQGKDAFVRLAKDETMKVGLDTIAVAIEKELERPRISKEAIEAAAQLIQGQVTREGLKGSELAVENYKQSHLKRLEEERKAKSQDPQQGPTR